MKRKMKGSYLYFGILNEHTDLGFEPAEPTSRPKGSWACDSEGKYSISLVMYSPKILPKFNQFSRATS